MNYFAWWVALALPFLVLAGLAYRDWRKAQRRKRLREFGNHMEAVVEAIAAKHDCKCK